MALLLAMDNVSSGLIILLVLMGICAISLRWFSNKFGSQKSVTKKAVRKGLRQELKIGISPGISSMLKVFWFGIAVMLLFIFLYPH